MALLEFLLASVGAAALAGMAAKDFIITKKIDGGRVVMTPFHRKPFTCPLCMGFYIGSAIWWVSGSSAGVWDCMVHGFMAGAVSWAAERLITGKY